MKAHNQYGKTPLYRSKRNFIRDGGTVMLSVPSLRKLFFCLARKPEIASRKSWAAADNIVQSFGKAVSVLTP